MRSLIIIKFLFVVSSLYKSSATISLFLFRVSKLIHCSYLVVFLALSVLRPVLAHFLCWSYHALYCSRETPPILDIGMDQRIHSSNYSLSIFFLPLRSIRLSLYALILLILWKSLSWFASIRLTIVNLC